MSKSEKHYDADYSLTAVETKDKKGFLAMMAVMLGFTFFSASMWAGGTIGTGMNFKDFMLSVLTGNLILGVYTALLAYIASDTGLSTHLLAKYSFGERGSYLVSFILGITQVGWFGVGLAMFALPLQKVTGINIYILIAISGVLMTSSAYFGMKTLTLLSIIAVPSIAALGSLSVFKAVDSVGGIQSLMNIQPTGSITFTTALGLCVGSFISGGTLTPDFTRFAKSKKVGVLSTVIAFFLGNSLMFLFGAVGAMVTGKADISEVMMIQGIIVPAIVILGFNIWTTNDNAIYASGLGFSNITKIPKNKVVIFNGILGTIMSLWLYNNFVGWLNFLNSIIPPIGGILIVDYFIIHRKKYGSYENTNFKNVNYIAVISWFIGVIGSKFIPGISVLNSVIVSMIVYVIGSNLSLSNKNSKVLEEKEVA
ncbi:cytosine permease [Clostridium sp. MSJ-4]|uniref:Cytosine permease n=1 Tax=Clostridium simiarum TaxID=2841506 RepID=A0ABS6F136_9CLOT|nr:cytosine permease [Clostridium simiarum]MBU5592219.1 cytosine permease [Clostridium simiarum]